ncbi:MAG: hypothetical protein ACYS18_04535 [Planctomycetota bacterium]
MTNYLLFTAELFSDTRLYPFLVRNFVRPARPINQKTKKMQNKPNLSLRRQGSSSTIIPYSTRRYKNFTRHSVSEGGPKQTQSKPNFKRPTPQLHPMRACPS